MLSSEKLLQELQPTGIHGRATEYKKALYSDELDVAALVSLYEEETHDEQESAQLLTDARIKEASTVDLPNVKSSA